MAADPAWPDVLLILDDYHLISSDSVHGPVRFLLEHRPPQLRIVLAGRSEPPLGLARYRGRGQLSEDAARFVAAFTGSHRYILDYLTEEVLERQRPELRDFLLDTSVLERLSSSLCDAVTGRVDSQELLEEVDRSGLFAVQLDDVRGWWRYHHLFSDLLRARLEKDPERARRLHRNAAGWYEQRELPDEAIRHREATAAYRQALALAANDAERAFLEEQISGGAL